MIVTTYKRGDWELEQAGGVEVSRRSHLFTVTDTHEINLRVLSLVGAVNGDDFLDADAGTLHCIGLYLSKATPNTTVDPMTSLKEIRDDWIWAYTLDLQEQTHKWTDALVSAGVAGKFKRQKHGAFEVVNMADVLGFRTLTPDVDAD
jgi:hypothetical protein